MGNRRKRGADGKIFGLDDEEDAGDATDRVDRGMVSL